MSKGSFFFFKLVSSELFFFFGVEETMLSCQNHVSQFLRIAHRIYTLK